jgi:hypothetical protein
MPSAESATQLDIQNSDALNRAFSAQIAITINLERRPKLQLNARRWRWMKLALPEPGLSLRHRRTR